MLSGRLGGRRPRSTALGARRRSAGEHRRALAHPAFEDAERHRPVAQHLVELLDVEPVAERLLRFGAGADPGGVPDLVAAGLADLRAITLDLALRARAG